MAVLFIGFGGGCLVSPDSHPVIGRFTVPGKDVTSSVSNAGVPMVCVSRTMPSQLADSAKKCWIPFVTHSGCLVSPNSHPVFGRFTVPEKKVLLSVSNAGVPIVCVSQTMFSPLSDSSKNYGLPFVSHSVTAPIPQFIFGTLGGPSRSFSIHAGKLSNIMLSILFFSLFVFTQTPELKPSHTIFCWLIQLFAIEIQGIFSSFIPDGTQTTILKLEACK
ncbi:uncharacterized protein [Miscanthus floridulus]|uniref:uncharacterized protein n=1 Tax=Miscanthus floridulus TaxID=154761 RepID=UPI00345858A5